MATTRRRWSKDKKLAILAQIESGDSIAKVARENDMAPTQIYQWQRLYREKGESAFHRGDDSGSTEVKIAGLERKIGQLTVENDLLKKEHNTYQKNFLNQAMNGGK